MNEIKVFEQFETDLASLELSNAEMEFPSTPDGLAERRAWHRKLRKGTNALDKIRKEAGAEYLRLGREVNAEAKSIQVRLDAMELPHKTILDAEDAKLQKVIDDLAEKNRLQAEYDEDERLAWLEYRELHAQVIIDEADRKVKAAQKLLDDAETQRKATEATAKAVEDAQKKAKIDAINADVLAKKAVADAILETKRIAHQEKNNLIAKQLKEANEARAEKERLIKIEVDRVADVEHRKEVEQAVIKTLSFVLDECLNLSPDATAQAVVDAIVDGEILNLKIVY